MQKVYIICGAPSRWPEPTVCAEATLRITTIDARERNRETVAHDQSLTTGGAVISRIKGAVVCNSSGTAISVARGETPASRTDIAFYITVGVLFIYATIRIITIVNSTCGAVIIVDTDFTTT